MRFLLLLLPLIVFACASDGSAIPGYQSLDLLQYDVPVKILAPDSAKVKTASLSGVMQDITVRSPEDDYAIQILASQASTNDMARLKAEQLELVRGNRYFSSVVSEDENGFIFENKIDTTSMYGFRHIVYKGNREFVFQNSFEGVFTLPQVERMYKAVRTSGE